ncbi:MULTISPECIES: hypothetical protein [unclassified Paenibacillus]|uniref:hypothetical protein n=1 Tax=unclassified Paenibacillus TaxID=185978 RepID=UPI00034E742B|nr:MULTISPECIES: hypothetical protein [unclassified Paenibacillus]EPD81368.1 hypothetical protein HMPREF1207_05126 [Paenibacillus sp. HGH0039]
MKFYAIVNNEEGKSVILESAQNTRHMAEKDVLAQCRDKGYKFKHLHLLQGSQKQGGVNTKFFKDRKRTGKNGKRYASFM